MSGPMPDGVRAFDPKDGDVGVLVMRRRPGPPHDVWDVTVAGGSPIATFRATTSKYGSGRRGAYEFIKGLVWDLRRGGDRREWAKRRLGQ